MKVEDVYQAGDPFLLHLPARTIMQATWEKLLKLPELSKSGPI